MAASDAVVPVENRVGAAITCDPGVNVAQFRLVDKTANTVQDWGDKWGSVGHFDVMGPLCAGGDVGLNFSDRNPLFAEVAVGCPPFC